MSGMPAMLASSADLRAVPWMLTWIWLFGACDGCNAPDRVDPRNPTSALMYPV
jgi:hypothetical protein